MAKNNGKKNELTIIDEIRKDVVLKDSNRIPVSAVFGRGLSEKQESFGGRSLAENAMRVDQAMVKMDNLHDLWNHSHTQWVWKHITCSWLSPYANIKQVTAEMQRKRGALNEAKWKQVKNEVRIQKYAEELDRIYEMRETKADPELDKWKEVDLKIKLAQLKEGIEEGNKLIEGALKDVLILEKVYEELQEQIDGFTEEELELQESKSHLKRSLMQSIRDVRQYGVITKGEQEYMEQVGCNPTKIQNLLRAQVEKEEKDESWNNLDTIKFIDEVVEDLIDNHKVDVERLKIVGFNPEVIPGIGWHKKVAEKEFNGV